MTTKHKHGDVGYVRESICCEILNWTSLEKAVHKVEVSSKSPEVTSVCFLKFLAEIALEEAYILIFSASKDSIVYLSIVN